MATLKNVLRDWLPDGAKLGDATSSRMRDDLAKRLEVLAADLTRVYWLRIGLAVAVLVVLIALAIWCRAQPALLTALFGAMGLTVAGGFSLLKDTTDELARARLLLAIAPELPLEELIDLVRKLSQKL